MFHESKKTMNILFLCTFYHRAMIFHDAIQSLQPLGYKVKVFNAVAKGEKIEEKYRGIMDENVVHCECFQKYDRYTYFHKQRKIRKALLREVEIGSYDLIHSHTFFNGGWVVKRIWKQFGIPYVVTVRNTDLNSFLRVPGFRMIARSIAREAIAIQFLSEAYETAFLQKCFSQSERTAIKEKCRIIVNGAEAFWLENRGKPKSPHSGTLRLICVGKIDRNKNMETVVKVAEARIKKGLDTRLVVIGQVVDPSVYKVLQNNPIVTMIPYQKKETLLQYYRDSDIFVMPSYSESFGRVYVEAMSQGLPVIYTRGQGFDGQFSEGEVGFSVKADDVEEITEAVERILARYEQISANCITACGRFDWNEIAVQLDEFYRKREKPS